MLIGGFGRQRSDVIRAAVCAEVPGDLCTF